MIVVLVAEATTILALSTSLLIIYIILFLQLFSHPLALDGVNISLGDLFAGRRYGRQPLLFGTILVVWHGIMPGAG